MHSLAEWSSCAAEVEKISIRFVSWACALHVIAIVETPPFTLAKKLRCRNYCHSDKVRHSNEITAFTDANAVPNRFVPFMNFLALTKLVHFGVARIVLVKLQLCRLSCNCDATGLFGTNE